MKKEIKSCECGSKKFTSICSTNVEMEILEDGTLKSRWEENLGDNGIYICNKCEKEYTRSDFVEIIY